VLGTLDNICHDARQNTGKMPKPLPIKGGMQCPKRFEFNFIPKSNRKEDTQNTQNSPPKGIQEGSRFLAIDQNETAREARDVHQQRKSPQMSRQFFR
jgi:hypothetical protein